MRFINFQTKAALNLILAALFFTIIFIFNPAQNIVFIPCWFYKLTGYLCPGCGGLRGTHLLLHGHFAEAFKLNILIFFFLPAYFLFLLNNIFLLLKNKKLFEIKIPDYLIYLFSVLIIIYWIVRNIGNLNNLAF